jgi:hypothetical protein
MPSSTAKKFKDAYFTSIEDAQWCMSKLKEVCDLDGKSALEPAVGSGVFIEASKDCGLIWTTNDLYPEFSKDFTPDLNVDFGRVKLSELGTYDVIITNPPFGEASSLAKKFLKRSLQISGTVAMLLPRGCRRGTFIDKHIPRDVKILLDLDLPGGTFLLPDGGTKDVGCVFMVFQYEEGYYREDILEYEPDGYQALGAEFRPRRGDDPEKWWPDWATDVICLWGSAGKMYGRERKKPFACAMFISVSEHQREIIKGIDWEPTISRYKTTSPMVTYAEAVTVINEALRANSK